MLTDSGAYPGLNLLLNEGGGVVYHHAQQLCMVIIMGNFAVCSSRKYPYSPQEIPVYFHIIISSKNLALKTPLPLGISNDLPWGGSGFFLELHNEE